jgi:hypothetical protein
MKLIMAEVNGTNVLMAVMLMTPFVGLNWLYPVKQSQDNPGGVNQHTDDDHDQDSKHNGYRFFKELRVFSFGWGIR